MLRSHRCLTRAFSSTLRPTAPPRGVPVSSSSAPSQTVTDIFGNQWNDEVGSVPQFLVTEESGFLPRQAPLTQLPAPFEQLETLLQQMPITTADGMPGLLQKNEFGSAVEQLPNLSKHIHSIEDSSLLNALFRDYTFAASSYLLEPCHHTHQRTGGETYGLGRDVLPAQLALPLTLVASKIQAKPFMEYALSYALYNYRKLNEAGPVDFDNLDTIRLFDGNEAESGFILVHVCMVAHSGELCAHTRRVLESARTRDRQGFDDGLRGVLAAARKINRAMETMWKRSATKSYTSFRTFIMGTKNQPMFPNGVVYQGVSDQPQFFRGESGANDSMIPTLDNLLQITQTLPSNPLTASLKDFRTYRPIHHNQWVDWVEHEARCVGVRNFAQGSARSTLLYLNNMDQIRDFRLRHWNFTKEYIIKNSPHPVATGGTPITTWLPNQLRAVLEIMGEVGDGVRGKDEMGVEERQQLEEVVDRAKRQRDALVSEVDEMRAKYGQ